jgi:prepilin-type N-terminal cleavage/methylation domain-containing protein
MRARCKGFTLLEMIVVIAIIVAFAGVLVPVVRHELEGTRLATARSDVARLASAVNRYMTDTSYAPTGKNGAPRYHFLATSGRSPEANSFASGGSGSTVDFLERNTTGTAEWRGPYVMDLGPDPWGSCYLINTHGFFTARERVWVLSAGPNRRVETRPKDDQPQGDDIAVILE